MVTTANNLATLHHLAIALHLTVAEVVRELEAAGIAPVMTVDGRPYYDVDQAANALRTAIKGGDDGVE